MKRNPHLYMPCLLDLIEFAEAEQESRDDFMYTTREALAKARPAQPSYREQYQ